MTLSSKFPRHISPVPKKTNEPKNLNTKIAILRSLDAAQFIGRLTDNRDKRWFNNNNNQGLENENQKKRKNYHSW